MESIIQQLTDWLKGVLVSGIMDNLTNTFSSVNDQVRNKVKSEMDEISEHCRDSEFQKPDLYDIVSKEEVAGLEQSMQKIFADIITEVSSIACWVYVEKYMHHKSLQEMLAERKDVDKFIFAVDTWFEKLLGA